MFLEFFIEANVLFQWLSKCSSCWAAKNFMDLMVLQNPWKSPTSIRSNTCGTFSGNAWQPISYDSSVAVGYIPGMSYDATTARFRPAQHEQKMPNIKHNQRGSYPLLKSRFTFLVACHMDVCVFWDKCLGELCLKLTFQWSSLASCVKEMIKRHWIPSLESFIQCSHIPNSWISYGMITWLPSKGHCFETLH